MSIHDIAGTVEQADPACDALRRLILDAEIETLEFLAHGALNGYKHEMDQYRRMLANGLSWQGVDETRWRDDYSRTNAEALMNWSQESLRRAGAYLSLVHLLDES